MSLLQVVGEFVKQNDVQVKVLSPRTTRQSGTFCSWRLTTCRNARNCTSVCEKTAGVAGRGISSGVLEFNSLGKVIRGQNDYICPE